MRQMSSTFLKFVKAYRCLEWMVHLISSTPDEATGELEKTWSLEEPNGVFEPEEGNISMGGSGVANRLAQIGGVW